MIFRHASVEAAVNIKMMDMLVGQLESSPMERVRASALQHLYSTGVTLKHISNAYLRDLEAGDRILNQRSHEEQNAAPETQKWLEWLKAYEAVEEQLQRIEAAISTYGESEDAA